MIDIKKLIVTALSLLGLSVVFASLSLYTPSWLYWSMYVISMTVGMLYIAYETKPKLRHWLVIIKYVGKDGKPYRRLIMLHGMDKPFFTKDDVDDIKEWISFNCIEITESTAGLISKKIEEQNQNER